MHVLLFNRYVKKKKKKHFLSRKTFLFDPSQSSLSYKQSKGLNPGILRTKESPQKSKCLD